MDARQRHQECHATNAKDQAQSMSQSIDQLFKWGLIVPPGTGSRRGGCSSTSVITWVMDGVLSPSDRLYLPSPSALPRLPEGLSEICPLIGIGMVSETILIRLGIWLKDKGTSLSIFLNINYHVREHDTDT